MNEKTGMSGEWVIEIVDAASGEVLRRERVKNLLTSINQTYRDQMLMGTAGDPSEFQIKFIAFGTGNTPASVNDTQLVNEVYRKQITQLTNPQPGVVRSVLSLGTQEANYTLQEIGVFCGPSATSAANTGTMISRAIINVEKNSNLVINFFRQDNCNIN